MRTLRITLLSSMAGWLAGFVVGSVGGFVLAWVLYGPAEVRPALTLQRVMLSETWCALVIASAVLPGSLFLVAPLVFQALERSFWHPFKAAGVGGGLGLVWMVCWYALALLFTVPVNWSRPGEGLTAVVWCVPTFLAIGGATGCVAARMGRTAHAFAPPASATSAGPELPPPVPYEY